MATLREIVARFGIKTDKNSFGVAEKSISGLKKAAIGLGAILVSGAAARGLGFLVESASDASENLNVLSAVFGEELTDATVKWSQTTAKEVGRSEFALQKFAAITGAMLKPMVGSADQAIKMSQNIATLAVDMASFFNVADDQALNALRSGLTGELEPLKRFGIVMTQAALNAFALTKGITTQVNKMSEAQKATLRYNFIMEQTKDAQGDAARTADGWANASRAVMSAATDLATRLGKSLLPTAEKLVVRLRDNVFGMIDWVKANEGLIRQNVEKTLNAIGDALQIVSIMFKATWNVVKALIGTFMEMHTIVKVLIVAFLAMWFSALLGPILLKLAIAAAIAFIILVIDDFIGFLQGKQSIIGEIFDGIAFLAGEAWKWMADQGLQAFDDVVEFFDIMGTKLATIADTLTDDIIAFFDQMATDVAETWDEIIGNIEEKVKKGIGFIKNLPGVGSVLSFFGGGAGPGAQAGANPSVSNQTNTGINNQIKNEINVNAPPGMDQQSLANEIVKAADERIQQTLIGAASDLIPQPTGN